MSFRRRPREVTQSSTGADRDPAVQSGALGNDFWRAIQDLDECRCRKALHAVCQLLEESFSERIRPPEHRSEAEQLSPVEERHTFFVDAMFLKRSYRYVCRNVRHHDAFMESTPFKEVFHYCTGLQVDESTFVMGHIVPVKFSHQSATGVRVADASNIAALASLDAWGLPLVSHFHSHPGFGVDANHPSDTDLRFQERLERGGHIAIGGIFSRDGFLRFFAGNSSRFTVRVCGQHLEKIDDNVYRILVDDRDVSIADADSRS